VPFEVHIRQEGPASVVAFTGALDSSLPAETRRDVVALVKPGCQLVFDLSGLARLSGTGLRMLLLLIRAVQGMGGTVAGAGVPQELRDIAAAAGFLELLQQPPSDLPPVVPGPSPVARVDIYPTHHHAGFALRPGFPLPFGATELARGVNFAVYSRYASSCTLVLFEPGVGEPVAEIPFPPEFRIGDVFAMIVFDLDPDNFEYGVRMDGPYLPAAGHRFDRGQILLDPMAPAVSGRDIWGTRLDPSRRCPYRARIIPEDFDWEGDRPLELAMQDLVIYEMHVRGFTRSSTSAVKFPGTFTGVREKIPYLKALGINCLELMPVFEFDELENPRTNPLTGDRLYNYWGYSTLGFYAPKAGYAATGQVGMQADEFKALVKTLHRNGIEVILDVVFNHTAEGNEQGPTISFRGLDNRTYYMLTPDGQYHNFSGCGNTLNCNHPVVRDFVLSCLRHWVAEYHVDGFRFDLASILGRDADGTPLPNPPLLEALAMDPVLGKTKLIAEAWDAGGLYQVGSFPAYGRWTEWNGKYRDCVRKFLKGDMGQVSDMAQRFLGSPDLYPIRGPTASINFVTCHDGFTLADLVSYNHKHNDANGEENRDGTDDNLSWNGGVEGSTDDPQILALRRRQIKNALTMLLLSQGVPMLLMGDESGRTQRGNNNAYCHDSPLTWLDWSLQEHNSEIFHFCQQLIAFRQSHPVLRQPRYAGPESRDGNGLQVTWHGTRAWRPDWAPSSRVLACTLCRASEEGADVLYVAMNMYWEALTFALPSPPPGQSWHIFANTALAPPADICEPGQEPSLAQQHEVLLGGRAVLVLVAR
jgi:glycogen operon protein